MNGSNRWFSVPDNYELKDNAAGFKMENGKRMFFVNGVVWFTNVPHDKRNTPIELYKKYNPAEYQKYDNYEAIEVSRVENIPIDYQGIMGVPISFLHKYCPEQFEIVGKLQNSTGIEYFDYGEPIIRGRKKYARILIKKITDMNLNDSKRDNRGIGNKQESGGIGQEYS